MKTEHRLNAISWASLSKQVIDLIADHTHQQRRYPARIELLSRLELGSMPAHIEREIRHCLDIKRIAYRIALGRVDLHQLVIYWPETGKKSK